MPDHTPLAQLVLWVPPAIAAGWEHLPAERQQWWTAQLTYHWLALITTPGPEPVLSKCGLVRSHAQYETFQRRMAEIEAQYPRVPAPPPDVPPIPTLPTLPVPPPSYGKRRTTPEDHAAVQAYEEAISRYNVELLAALDQLNARNAAILKHQKDSTPPSQAEDTP